MTVSYSELVTQIRAYTEVDSSVLSDTIVNDFIEFAENRIFRDVDIDVFKSHQTANLTASNPFLSLPGGSSPHLHLLVLLDTCKYLHQLARQQESI